MDIPHQLNNCFAFCRLFNMWNVFTPLSVKRVFSVLAITSGEKRQLEVLGYSLSISISRSIRKSVLQMALSFLIDS